MKRKLVLLLGIGMLLGSFCACSETEVTDASVESFSEQNEEIAVEKTEEVNQASEESIKITTPMLGISDEKDNSQSGVIIVDGKEYSADITELDLARCKPTMEDLEAIKLFKNLEVLNLSYNELEDITSLGELVNLKESLIIFYQKREN